MRRVEQLVDTLISAPVASIRQWRPQFAEDLATIEDECRQRLASLELTVVRQHGDYAPTYVLWDPVGAQVVN